MNSFFEHHKDSILWHYRTLSVATLLQGILLN
jgi:hypothetical protein